MIITAYILSAIVFFVLFTKYMKRRLEYITRKTCSSLYLGVFSGLLYWLVVLCMQSSIG